MLEEFDEIKVESPVDKIIRQIRGLITNGQLKPGDKLPPERKLAEKFGVGRTAVRDAIRKLEFYGIVKILPQSGTVVSGLGIAALEGLITDVLDMEEVEFTALVETRVILEINSAIKAAERRTSEDIIALKNALLAYETKVKEGHAAIEEDLLFHLKIAEASKNSVLKSLMLIITPDILNSFVQLKVCDANSLNKTVQEHREILQFIIDKDVKGVEEAMTNHLKDILEISGEKDRKQSL